MPRPTKKRAIAFMPEVTYFKPAGVPLREMEEIELTYEELEALRLKDVEGLDQQDSSERMEVSRPTFQNILTTARRKVSEALVNGKAIQVKGGNHRFIDREGYPKSRGDHPKGRIGRQKGKGFGGRGSPPWEDS